MRDGAHALVLAMLACLAATGTADSRTPASGTADLRSRALGTADSQTTAEDVVARLTARIPARPDGAPTGSEFFGSLAGVGGAERERAILEQLSAGNLPAFLRRLRPIELTHHPPGARKITATIWVMPDYLAVGSDDDFVRVPVDLHTAVRVGRAFDFILPTRKMVDAIHAQADHRFSPRPMKPGPRMTSSAYYRAHNDTIRDQRGERPLGELWSGHKKDLVLTQRLARKAGRVAIYGWHRRDGTPIQPLSTVHGARYADYSHGVRLVSTTVFVDGTPRSIFEVLADRRLSGLLSYEGTIPAARKLMRPADEVDPAR